MGAAARGKPYRIGCGGRCQYHSAPEAARAFMGAAQNATEGAPVGNLGGPALEMAEVVSAIEAAAPEVAGQITYEETPLPFPAEFESSAPLTTPIEQGVGETIELFRRRSGRAPGAA